MRTKDKILCGIGLVLVAISAGCRSRCGNACGYGPTIAPPPTYSLNIPSAGGTNPYYVPGGATSTANLPAHLVDPSGRAPVPTANQTGTQNGWQPVGGNNLSGTNAAPGSNANSSTTFANNISNPSNLRTASATATAGSGSVNYQTTRVDERLDSTRLPANDATDVRAPSQIVTASGTRLAQIQQPAAPIFYNGSPSVGGNGLQSGQPVYYGQVYATPYGNQNHIAAPTVLAQSTTGLPGNNSGGWRDREITAGRDSMNR